LHRDRARVALLAKDQATFRLHTAKACAEFMSADNPMLLRQANRLVQLTQGTQDPTMDLATAIALEQEPSLLTSMVGVPADVAAKRALQHLVMLSGASRGYLYRVENGQGVLRAQHGEGEAEPPLQTEVEQLLASYTERFETEMADASEAASMTANDTSYRLLPLVTLGAGHCQPVGVVAVFNCESPQHLTHEQLEKVAAVLQPQSAVA
jgi:hypothetical protein